MFGGISNDECDHWNPMSSNPIIPESQLEINNTKEDEEHEPRNPFFNWSYKEDEEEVHEVSPSIANKKREARVVLEIPKNPKSSTTLVIEELITKIAEPASSFTSKKEGGVTIKEVMGLILECGEDYGTNEHFVATQMFMKKDQREIFLTLPTNIIRFDWLTRMYNKFEK
jgi:hypothetical protein